MLHVYSVINHK